MAKRGSDYPPHPDSLMTHSQLVDSLTAHISLYDSSLSSPPNPNPNPRSAILKWFSSLTVHQRQSHLTVVDPSFTQLLLQMLAKLRTYGHGRFIILPDLPSSPSSRLPGLCYKRSRGLLLRAAESNDAERLIFESVRIFGSGEGEKMGKGCCCSVKSLDSVTVCEELVEDLEKFVEIMDEVSKGRFLRGEERELGSDWVELEWLKERGYYSLEAFVANRLDVALRLAWLSCGGNGKKLGVKLKEKVAATGIAGNVYWRKKGCVDWWRNLDARTRRNFLTTVFGKAAKSLTCEVIKEASSALEDDEMWLFKAGAEQPLRCIYAESTRSNILKPSADGEFGSAILSRKASPLAHALNSLLVLQDIVSFMSLARYGENNVSKLFFSTLVSVNTIRDCMLRKLRGLVMVISLDCTKLELLEEGNFNSLSNKPKEKNGAGIHRKKGKTRNTRKPNPFPAEILDKSAVENSLKDQCKFAPAGPIPDTELMDSNRMLGIPERGEIHKEMPSPTVEMERSQGLVHGKRRTAARKNRKGKNKSKNSCFNNPIEVRNPESSVAESNCTAVTSSHGAVKLGGVSDNSSIQNEKIDNFTEHDTLSLNIVPGNFSGEPTEEDLVKPEDHVVGQTSSEHDLCSYSLIENQTIPFTKETSNYKGDCDAKTHMVPAAELDTISSNRNINFQHKRVEAKCDITDQSVRTFDVKEKPTFILGQENDSFYGPGPTGPFEYLSYEWPTLAPVFFPSINPHLPPATDRLHLDVGRNWHNHIRQSFVPTVHQARNSPIEAGCNHMLSRPLPMSLDWPPVVRSTCGLAPYITCNYGSGFIARRQSAFQQNSTAQNVQINVKSTDGERKYSGDFVDLPEVTNVQELTDECESHWISEEEFEVHAVSGIDYNQYFGGGVMYWDPSDLPGAGFSRPPSLSSDDSLWAWREADMSRAVDDMVAFSSPYSTTGLASPTAASGHQALGYVVSGNEVAGKVLHSSSTATDATTDEEVSGSLSSLSGDVEGKVGDSLPYPILRPIIIPNMSRERSRSDFRRSHDHKSPCVPPTRHEQPRIKRPPSPVVLCVPRAPCPPPPSPVSESRKHRGFPTVRSGSSSPRHWCMRGWYHDGTNSEEACVRMEGSEVVWPSWRNKSLPTHPMIQPLPGALLQDRLIAMSQLTRDQEHPDVSIPLQPCEIQNCPTRTASLSLMHSLLHDEIDFFCNQVVAENMARKPFINWAVKRVTRSLQVLWPRSRTNIFGSNATGLSLPTSDVDLVVCLPPVRNLEPIKEAGILEGRNGIKETCLQHAARYLANQEWVKNDSLKTVENTAIPIIMLVVDVPSDLITCSASNAQSPEEAPASEHDNHAHSNVVCLEDAISPNCSQINYDSTKNVKSVRLDISFKSPSHTGLQTTEMVKELTEQFPAATPLALILKQFLADRSLDQSYSGGLSSYCLVLLIIRFLQHEHHLGRPINQNFGSLLMDFLYFFGNVFDPRQMRISVQGSGVYINRERGYSIDPIHIDDPLFPTNNVGRNCFRIHQCIKAFSEAYSILENELTCLPDEGDKCSRPPYKLLSKIISSTHLLQRT